jgi:hypothetical protein
VTTPHQPAPDGAYVIGGGSPSGDLTRYGQDLTDSNAAALMTGGFTAITNPVAMLAQMSETLLTLPLEVLQLFGPLIPGAGIFSTVAEAVEAITGWFTQLAPMLLTAFNDWVSGVFNILATTVQQVMDIFAGLIVTPISAAVQAVKDWFSGLMGDVGGLFNGIQGIIDAVLSVIRGIPFVGGTLANLFEDLTGWHSDTVSTSNTLVTTNQNVYNSWFGGSSAVGTPAEVATTVAAIKTAIGGGFTLETFTTNAPSWLIPPGVTEITGIVINGGSKGFNGSTSGTSGTIAFGGAGGPGGGYISQVLNLTGLTPGTSTLAITVGAAASTAGTAGGQSKIVASTGTLLQGSPGVGGITIKEGLIATASAPGSGGEGGQGLFVSSSVSASAGKAGTSSGIATGGAGGDGGAGIGVAADPGKAGAAGNASNVPLCGGGGGGGGGGRSSAPSGSATGGAGGNGGYPGGGSGGGGGAASPVGRTAGVAGTPANGFVALIYK